MIIGVVVKIGDHIEIRLPKPNRHHDCFRHFAEVTGKNAPATGLRTSGDNQGFYTDKGIFLNRKSALLHARRCGQLKNINAKHYLFSEDVW